MIFPGRNSLRHLWFGLLSATLLVPAGLPAQGLTVTGHVTVTAPSSRGRSAGNANAVVWLTPADAASEPVSAQSRAVPGHYRLVQKNKRFTPHILVVPVGAVVEFPNDDAFFHNVFSLFDGKRFDLGLYEAGSTKMVNFNAPGVSYIFCNIHPEMSAVVVVTKAPYYAISAKDGDIAIRNVPPGRYELQVWHERCLPETLKALSRQLVFSPSSTSLGEISLPATGDLLARHKNKYGRDYDPTAPSDAGYLQP